MNAHHDNAPLYRRFAELLHRTMGLDAASLGHNAIERAVDQRAAAWYADGHTGATLADYWDAAQATPAMVQALIETVVVPETWFFRDADAFKALARLAHERLLDRAAGLPLRILSLPCSTGEEPYTIAMTLLDAGIDAARLRIDAMDISERSLALAQRAIYGRNSFRGNALAFRDAHFTRTEDGWRLAPRIVDAVRFSRANLMQLDAAALGVYDFVFCRNVLIYFDRETQQTALHALTSVLAENGTLFVGPAETGLLMRHGMQSVKIPLAFAFQRAAPADAPWHGWHTAPLASAAALAMTHSPVPALSPAHAFSAEPFAWPDPVARTTFDEMTRPAPLDGSTRTTSLDGATRFASFNNGLAAHTGKPSMPASPVHDVHAPRTNAALNAPLNGSLNPLINQPANAPTTAARDTLQAAHALADAGRLAEAAAAINAYLELHAPHADAFYLLGVLADANGDTNLARGQYRKALYLDPQHAEALAHLAALLELEGDRDGARRLMQRASRAQGAPRD
ncbi:CheR family methyltransferase [Paraburkholderia ginsengisoli]|uniref:Protein-glutamate O-methyltransferase CheR n=1 Tax=Paraburkholderia ginsengisoli TaxID=311231 RepID=A0A7T4T7I8_9BURK|nr:protein-glutamate O-methyltransferase CheR [Paraburkholderia ginsengisoli]QQC62910.1 protein-glutamate O-methyltransferase CheR [Paraburkholderia ginsengisoli]